jgi:hypothetical protein
MTSRSMSESARKSPNDLQSPRTDRCNLRLACRRMRLWRKAPMYCPCRVVRKRKGHVPHRGCISQILCFNRYY